MNNKTEESRIAYNKIASEYDTSKEGGYIREYDSCLKNALP